MVNVTSGGINIPGFLLGKARDKLEGTITDPGHSRDFVYQARDYVQLLVGHSVRTRWVVTGFLTEHKDDKKVLRFKVNIDDHTKRIKQLWNDIVKQLTKGDKPFQILNMPKEKKEEVLAPIIKEINGLIALEETFWKEINEWVGQLNRGPYKKYYDIGLKIIGD